MRDLALEAPVLRGVAPVDGIHFLGQLAQVFSETRDRVRRRRFGDGSGVSSLNRGRQKLHACGSV